MCRTDGRWLGLSTALVVMAFATSCAAVAPPEPVPVLRSWAAVNEIPGYSPDRALALEDAASFDVLVAHRDTYVGHVEAMRAENAGLRIFVYLNGSFVQGGEGELHPADWYARDESGHKLYNEQWGLWLMDPAHQGWVRDRAQTCERFLDESGYDGCFIDDLGTGAILPSVVGGEAIDPRTAQAWTHETRLRATSGLAAAVRRAVDPAPVLGNGLGNGQRFLDEAAGSRGLFEVLDMAVAETWLRAAHDPVHSPVALDRWRADLALLETAGAAGDEVLVLTKVWETADEAAVAQWYDFAVASFLLSSDGRAHFSFSPERGVIQPLPQVATDLGRAVGSAEEQGGVQLRRFEHGIVAVNPRTTTQRLDLDESLVTAAGTTSSEFTLAPGTGLLLTAANR